jgi:hypothetical protein
MSSFEDPSIISMEPSQVPPTTLYNSLKASNEGGNAILDLLKQGEKKKEEEEKESLNDITKSLTDAETNRERESLEGDEKDKDMLPTGGSKSTQFKEIEATDWEFAKRDFRNTRVTRYLPSELLSLRHSPLVAPPEGLPLKSYYRLNAKMPQNTSRRGGYGYQARGNYDTGAMGNFNLKNNRFSKNGQNGRRSQRSRKQDDTLMFDRNAPAPENPDDFEKWRAQMKMERNGGETPRQEIATPTHEEPRNAVDSFFGLAGNSLQARNDKHDFAEGAKNSRFFSMFSAPEPTTPQEESPKVDNKENKDGVSKILSFLDRGEKAQADEQNSQVGPPPGLSKQSEQGSQFFSHQNSPASQQAPQFPPGLTPQHSDQPPHGESFLKSLMKSTDSGSQQSPQLQPQQSTPEPRQQQKSHQLPQQVPQQHQQPQQPQQPQQLLQGSNTSSGSAKASPQQGPQIDSQRPSFSGPPGFQGMPPMPPWINPNMPPGMRQQFPPPPQGRYIPMPQGMQLPQGVMPQGLPQGLPQGMQFQGNGNFPPPPPHLRGNVPPHIMYPGQVNERGMPMFIGQGIPGQMPPPQGQQGQQQLGQQQPGQGQGQSQGQDSNRGLPPGLFQGPPPPGFMPAKRG